MKNKKGFTLVELMAVIIIISLIAILTFPNIINQIKKSKQATTNNINDIVISAAKRYVADNPDDFDGENYYISIKDLIDNDYVKEDIINVNDKDISNSFVYNKNGKYSITETNYTKIEYLESTGTQYIDSGVILPFTVEIKAKYNNFNIVSETEATLFGNQNARSPYNSTFVRYSSKSNNGAKCSNRYIINSKIINDLNIHTYRLSCFKNDGKFYLDNILKGTISSNVDLISYSIYLFATNNAGTAFHHMQGRIYYVKFYSDVNGTVLIHDFIPVLDKNGVASLYDKVEGKFYYNQGTGEFLWG